MSDAPAATPDKTTTVTASPVAVVSTTTTKSSAWSTEHVLAYVALALTAGYSSGLIPTDGIAAKIAACAAAVLVSLGYTIGRSMVKAAA